MDKNLEEKRLRDEKESEEKLMEAARTLDSQKARVITEHADLMQSIGKEVQQHEDSIQREI